MSPETQSIIHDTRPAPVQEPPLKNRKSCLRRGCSLTFGFLIVLLLLFFLLYWFFGNPKPQRTAALPSNFPTDIPLYKFEERATITYLASEQKNKPIQRIAQIPKIIFDQLLLTKKIDWLNLKQFIQTPKSKEEIDSTSITWENIEGERDDLYGFYQKNLKQQNFKVTVGIKTDKTLTLNFQKAEIIGHLTIEKIGTQGLNVTLEVNYPKK